MALNFSFETIEEFFDTVAKIAKYVGPVVSVVDPPAAPVVGAVEAGLGVAQSIEPAVNAAVTTVESNAPAAVKTASVVGDVAAVAEAAAPALGGAIGADVKEVAAVGEEIAKAL